MREELKQAIINQDNAKVKELVRLVDIAADTNALERSQDPLLYVAASVNNLYAAELLLNAGADINAIGGFDEAETSLHLATERGYEEMVRLLIARKADLEARSGRGPHTPLDQAVYKPAIAKILLEAGADPNADLGGRTPFSSFLISAEQEHIEELFHLYIEKGADLNYKTPELDTDYYGYRAGLLLTDTILDNIDGLIEAAAKGRWDRFYMLVEAGAPFKHNEAVGLNIVRRALPLKMLAKCPTEQVRPLMEALGSIMWTEQADGSYILKPASPALYKKITTICSRVEAIYPDSEAGRTAFIAEALPVVRNIVNHRHDITNMVSLYNHSKDFFLDRWDETLNLMILERVGLGDVMPNKSMNPEQHDRATQILEIISEEILNPNIRAGITKKTAADSRARQVCGAGREAGTVTVDVETNKEARIPHYMKPTFSAKQKTVAKPEPRADIKALMQDMAESHGSHVKNIQKLRQLGIRAR